MDRPPIGPSISLKGHFDQSKECNLLILSTMISQRYVVVCWTPLQSKLCSVGELAMNTCQGREEELIDYEEGARKQAQGKKGHARAV